MSAMVELTNGTNQGFFFFPHAAGLLAHHSLLVHSVQLQGVT